MFSRTSAGLPNITLHTSYKPAAVHKSWTNNDIKRAKYVNVCVYLCPFLGFLLIER